MKKKIILAVIAVITLLSIVLAGCSKINVENTDFIDVIQNAIENSETYTTYYIREKQNTDPKNIAQNEMTEYMLNVQADDKSIEGVDNTKVNFSIKYTKGISEYTDSFIFGQSLSKNVKAKSAKADDYKLHVFENYKQSKTAPVFTKDCEEILKDDVLNYVTPTGISLSEYTMVNVLAPLKNLTSSDVKMVGKAAKKGKVTTYTFEVIKEGNKYKEKGQLQLKLYTDKKVTRVMALSSVDGKYVLDVMYQGPRIDIPIYDNYKVSDNKITLTSDRSDGLVALYTKDEQDGNIAFEDTINPVEIAEYKKEENDITYTYKITTVESAVNWGYEYTEIVIKFVGTNKDGIEVEYAGDYDYKGKKYFVQTKNIVKTKKDFSSMIPLAAVAVAVIALVIALMALFKIKKQNNELTKQIKILSGEVDEETETEEVAEKENETSATEQVAGVEENAEKKAETEETTEGIVEVQEETKTDEPKE